MVWHAVGHASRDLYRELLRAYGAQKGRLSVAIMQENSL